MTASGLLRPVAGMEFLRNRVFRWYARAALAVAACAVFSLQDAQSMSAGPEASRLSRDAAVG
jgi:hypothetical protein